MPAKQTRPRITPEVAAPPAPAGQGVHSRVAALPERLALRLLVFVAGAVLMGLEIVGSRILAPYFGNSVFVWGSLISLFLIALSAGYYIGGRVADRRPSRSLLAGIVIVVAASMFAVAAISTPVCDAILTAGFGEQSGPFLASVVLFLLPSLGMGMVSPFAVRLAAHTVASVGRTAGTLYALSTVGSIAGTVITTFVLIPSIGAGTILKSLAAVLLATGVLAFPFRSPAAAARGAALALAGIVVGLVFVGASRASLPPGQEMVLEVDTPYHHISVIDDKPDGVRQLRFDRFVESAVSLSEPHVGESLYTYYFQLAFLAKPDIATALFIGAGGGVGPRAFHMHNPKIEIDVVDIDPKVLEIARSQFFLEDSPQIHTIAEDGRTFVRRAKAASYDAIILDAFTIGGRIPFHLVTREFFELCKDRLANGGVFVMNINSAAVGPHAAIFRSMYKTVESVFPHTTVLVVGSDRVPAEQSTNIILLASKDGPTIDREQWLARAAQYTSASYIERTQIKRLLDDLLTTPPDVSRAAMFTDDYAPIETMSF